MTTRQVVITGMGALTNLGLDAASTWDAMVRAVSGIGPIDLEDFRRWSDDEWAVRIGGQIRDFDGAGKIEPRAARKLDRAAVLGANAAIEAAEQCGIDFTSGDHTRRGVIVGTGIGGIGTIIDAYSVLLEKGPRRINPFTVPKLMANATAGELSIRFNLQGPSSSHATACASSGHSMGDAYRIIARGEADVMISGGTEAAINPLCLGAFMTMKALSTRNDEPTRASRPFDRDRDGFVLAEGAAVFVLEAAEHARARGAEILCEVVGYAASSDASHITAPDAAGAGAARSMRGALADSGLNPDDIGYINAHGTSTPLGDAAEVAAVTSVFGDHARASAGGRLLMSSTKSMTGHCLGASGGVETIACINALRHGVIPPTINLDNPDEGFDVDLVPNVARDARINYAMNNTFGFGGHNVTLIFGKYQG
ncbi:MAG: beta-ketoacyl-ACP synthase II [Phycisphaerales bacterium]|nr:beta-ketoacyl-ACP synthase II [Phycisphaerales bacterium]